MIAMNHEQTMKYIKPQYSQMFMDVLSPVPRIVAFNLYYGEEIDKQ
jgi:hypothetical protein